MLYRLKTYVQIIFIMLLQVSTALAQRGAIVSDSTYQLDDITIEAAPVAIASMNQSIDSSALVMDNAIGVGGLLKYNSFVFIKDYGPGNMTTLSARGGSATQSQVFWNGININQAGLGMTDLSTLPPFLLDQITVQQSAAGALSGSGAMSGTIALNNKVSRSKGFSALLKHSYSSIAESNTGVRLSYSNTRLAADVRFLYIDSDNRYRFINTANRPFEKEQTQYNAGLIQKGYSATFAYQWSPKVEIRLYSWYTNFYRNVAPTVHTILKARQRDVSYRNSIQLTYKSNRSKWEYKLAYLKDQYDNKQRSAYSDSILNSDNGFTNNLINQIDFSHELGRGFVVNAGLTQFYQSIRNQKIQAGIKDRNRLSVYGGVTWTGKRRHTVITTLVREEVYDSRLSPFIGSMQLDQHLIRNLSLMLKGESYYRIPTMYDLYWGKGGNQDLNPEKGWSVELALAKTLKFNKVANTTTIGAFNRTVKDWILWTPGGEYNYWIPQNIDEVWSRGFEVKNDFIFNVSEKTTVIFAFKHTYQKTTSEGERSKDSEGYKKQLIYTPTYLGNASLIVQYKRFSINYFQQYTSWVFIQADENDYLMPYTYAMLRLQGGFSAGKKHLDVFAEVDNCWNASYQTVKDRPMPLRYFRIGLISRWN